MQNYTFKARKTARYIVRETNNYCFFYARVTCEMIFFNLYITHTHTYIYIYTHTFSTYTYMHARTRQILCEIHPMDHHHPTCYNNTTFLFYKLLV